MGSMINMPWLSRGIEVLESTDPTLVGISGTVLDETRRTLIVQTTGGKVTLAKDTIRFKIENEEIDGQSVGQRPEDRIGKRYRGA
ncbi:MAG: ribonuclease P protein component 1 [Rickettsiales bacterium]|nr:ribonuclease P protein component 1 [Rickettsiales bacterium]